MSKERTPIRRVADEWSKISEAGTIFETTPELRDALTRLSGEFRQDDERTQTR